MSPESKEEYYRLFTLLEHVEIQIQSLDLGPLRDIDTDRPLDAETEALRKTLLEWRDRITKAIGRLSELDHA